MEYLFIALQLAVGLTIINVWLLRKDKSTPWRGGTSKNMKEEFQAYGLPQWFMLAVCTLKVSLAVALIIGIWIPEVTPYAAIGLAVTLLAAVIAHIRINDPAKKSFPAATLMAMATALVLF